MELTSRTKWLIGLGAAVGLGVIFVTLRKRSKRAKAADKAGVDSANTAVALAVQQGLDVPQGANTVIREGISLLNQAKIDEWQFQALITELANLHFPQAALDKMIAFLLKNQSKVHADWDRHRKFSSTDKSKKFWDQKSANARLMLSLSGAKKARDAASSAMTSAAN